MGRTVAAIQRRQVVYSVSNLEQVIVKFGTNYFLLRSQPKMRVNCYPRGTLLYSLERIRPSPSPPTSPPPRYCSTLQFFDVFIRRNWRRERGEVRTGSAKRFGRPKVSVSGGTQGTSRVNPFAQPIEYYNTQSGWRRKEIGRILLLIVSTFIVTRFRDERTNERKESLSEGGQAASAMAGEHSDSEIE